MFRALIVDDEPSARAELRYLLEESGAARVVGEASTAEEAYELIKAVDYDVVFLDVRMPGMKGTELARLIKDFDSPPLVVFVSAYGEYAVDAFEIDATDYLVKPVSEERIAETIKRLKEKIRSGGVLDIERKPEKIFIDQGDRKIPLPISKVYFFEAQDDYSRLHTYDRSFLVNYSLKHLEEKLRPVNFLRVHRKYLVNMDKITEVITLSRSAYVLKLSDSRKSEIPVSRRKAAEIRRLMSL